MAYAKKNPRNVTEIIVPNDLCIGCGLCAAICPPQVLKMEFNAYGEYIPIEFREGCLPKCDLCLQTCPFWDQADNEDTLAEKAFAAAPEIAHTNETGYYLGAFAGYSRSREQRANGASGGLATWFLKTLLEQNIVDRVITVKPNHDPEKLFQFTIWENPQDLARSAQSVYYPVEMSEVIHEVLQSEARYAIVGLPCFLKAIRLAMRRNRRLRKRVVCLIGLVCGQTKSRFFAEYLCATSGGDPKQLERVRFRVKDETEHSAENFRFTFAYQPDSGTQETSLSWFGKPSTAWGQGWFKPNACNYCDDVFAEVADIAFMDAWLDRYSQDNRGTNLVLIRKSEFKSIFEQGEQKGEIFIEDVPIDDVIQSQRPVIRFKRQDLAERLGYSQRYNLPVPTKRVGPTKVTLWRAFKLWIEQLIRRESKHAWMIHGVDNDVERFLNRMQRLWFIKRIMNFITVRILRQTWSE